jgi:GNAT superfamily N-acetyltransferase
MKSRIVEPLEGRREVIRDTCPSVPLSAGSSRSSARWPQQGGRHVQYRDMVAGEEHEVLALVMRGFDELVRPDFSDEGVAEFTRAARSFVVERPPGHLIFVAERDGRIVGMVDVRDSSHVSLFFVEQSERGRGVGRALLDFAIERSGSAKPIASAITVNSSPWAVPVYQRLGFLATGPESETNGIHCVPMVRPETAGPFRKKGATQ